MKLFTFFFITFTQLVYQTSAQEKTNKQILWTADWSPDGRYIAVGGNTDTLKIYKSKNLKLHKNFPIKGTITCVKWHPTKNLLAISTQSSDDKARILNFERDRFIELEGISTDGARGIDWNFSGDYLAVADNDGQISIFDIHGNLIRKIHHDNTKSITGIDWHPKQNIFITVGDKIRIFDINGHLLQSIVHRKEGTLLLSVAWHPSGSFFATGDYGENENGYKSLLQFWSEEGQMLMSGDVSTGEYRNIRWNNIGTKLATASDALRIWDVKGNLIAEGSSDDYLWGLSWNKKGDRLVTSSKQQKVIIWDNKARRKMADE